MPPSAGQPWYPQPVADGDAFPSREDLNTAASGLEVVARRAARRIRLLRGRAGRREARAQLQESWQVMERLRAGEPGAAASRVALARSLALERALAPAAGQDPLAAVAPETLGRAWWTTPLEVALSTPPEVLRLRWPIQVDLHRFERIGDAGWAAYEKGMWLDRIAEALEARARQAAGLEPRPAREREPIVDVDTMELARSRRRQR